MSCPVCKREVPIKAKGLCAACYQRLLKKGSTEYQRKGKFSICTLRGCDKRAQAKGLCNTHAMRVRRHGHTGDTRPDSWGAKTKHPMYHSWQWMRRHRGHTLVCDEWEDFLQFVTDVGERPSPKHKLFPIKEDEPMGPLNFTWKKSLTERREGETTQEYGARVLRVYRKIKKEEFVGYGLKKSYGITFEDYERMHAEQSGLCAICRLAEAVKIRGKLIKLAVDHCHDTGKVRGLLCVNCNKALGHFKDDVELMSKAIQYLRK